jgi:hypothetical protein
MIATHFLYFSFFSAVWVWAVRTPEIDGFLNRTDNEPQWSDAYAAVDPLILVPYFAEYFEHIWNTVNNHLNPSPMDNINTATILQDPTLNAALEDFPRHIFLLRYANLAFLKLLKRLNPEREPDRIPVLALINDIYIHDHVTVRYHAQKGKVTRTGYMSYMIDLAVLRSMNEAMVNLVINAKLYETLGLGLDRYQDMIFQAHQTMALLMRIASVRSYTKHMDELTTEVFALRQSIMRGYDSPTIQQTIRKVVHQILAAILMYGDRSGDSPRVLSGLIQNNRAVLDFLILDRSSIQEISVNCERLLTCFKPVVEEILKQFGNDNPQPWVPTLVAMVEFLMKVGTGYGQLEE